ncbi:MAG: hypothetical protein COA52_00915 [Hyphomicrobiales bacterium]|nr:MAG: hypothetical protein COA52_00915 [Hyphomicrobiales bacterium]
MFGQHMLLAGSGTAFALDFKGFTVAAESGSTLIQQTTADLGDADAGRSIIVVGWSQAGAMSACSVAGIPATQISQSVDESRRQSVFIASVPTGLTGDISIITSGLGAASLAWYRIVGHSSNTPFDIHENLTGGSVTVDIPAGGAALAFAQRIDGSGGSEGWTNVDFVDVNNTTGERQRDAARKFASGGALTGHVMSIGGAIRNEIGMSWGP